MANSNRVTVPSERVFQFERELVDVTSNGPRPDPSWHFKDKVGHEHRQPVADSCEWVTTESWWCPDCHETHDNGEWQCVKCGETITPGTRGPSPYKEYAPGLESYLIDGESVTKETFLKEIDKEGDGAQ